LGPRPDPYLDRHAAIEWELRYPAAKEADDLERAKRVLGVMRECNELDSRLLEAVH
jgi:hypothetical protein